MSSNFKATVIKSGAKSVVCKIDESSLEVEGTLIGKLYKQKKNAVVGDVVILEKQENEDDRYLIKEILPRKNEISRIIVRERKKRAIASNCDYLIITVSVSKPKYKRGIIDRFLIRSIQWGIPAIVIFNKMDEWKKDNNVDLLFEQDRLKELNVHCFEVSALQREDYKNQFLKNGLQDLKEVLKGKTVILLGQSGVGKSHTISTLAGIDKLLLSGEISLDGKGKHTTTWCEKIDFENFSFIDSPGIRSFAIDDIEEENFIHYWPDLEKLGFNCKFKDCTHHESIKGCYIQDNFSENTNIMSRLDSFHDMLREVSTSKSWEKKYH